MKVSASISIAVFSTAALSGLAPIKARQIDVITSILESVGEGIEGVDSAATAYDGSDSSGLISASEDLVSTINEGTTTAEGSEDLDLEGALGLTGPVEELTDQATALVDNLTSKRDLIAENGECGTTREQVSNINTASNELIDAVISKVPEAAQDIAEGLAADLRAVLEEAQENFSEANCVDAEGGGGDETTTEPTPEPTSEPTSEPTDGPTDAPTTEPTEAPTSEPTDAPTPTPTDGSTPAPTSTPTETPTGVIPPPPGGNGTTTTPPPIPTGAAAGLFPAGALAIGLAAALL